MKSSWVILHSIIGGTVLMSCIVQDDIVPRNLPTREAQEELVAGLDPVVPKTRFAVI